MARGGMGPSVLVPLLRQPRLQWGPLAANRSEREREVWQASGRGGTHGNQAAFPNSGPVTQAVFLGFLAGQAGIIHAIVGSGVKMRIRPDECPTTHSHSRSSASPTGRDHMLRDWVGCPTPAPALPQYSSPLPQPLASIPCPLLLCTPGAPMALPHPPAETPGHGAPQPWVMLRGAGWSRGNTVLEGAPW